MQLMKNYSNIAILNTLGFIAVGIVNSLANGLPINGYTTGELSAFYPNLFVPAGITFSIWGVIYTTVILFIVYQWVVLNNKEKRAPIHDIGPWFFISCMANCCWIFSWHYMQAGLSVVIMLVLLSSLIIIYKKNDEHRTIATSATKFFIFMPFSLYLGWVSVATIANVTAFLSNLGWDGAPLTEATWTCLMIIIATMLALRFLLFKNDLFFALSIGWALAGILIRRMNDEDPYFSIIMTTNASILLITFGFILQLVRRKLY